MKLIYLFYRIFYSYTKFNIDDMNIIIFKNTFNLN